MSEYAQSIYLQLEHPPHRGYVVDSSGRTLKSFRGRSPIDRHDAVVDAISPQTRHWHHASNGRVLDEGR